MGRADHRVKPLDFPLLADENIAPDVVSGVRSRGHDVRSVWDEPSPVGLTPRCWKPQLALGASWSCMLRHSVGLLFGPGASFVGIVYLRPGHISAALVLDIVDALRASVVEVQSRFTAMPSVNSRLCVSVCG